MPSLRTAALKDFAVEGLAGFSGHLAGRGRAAQYVAVFGQNVVELPWPETTGRVRRGWLTVYGIGGGCCGDD